MKRQIDFKVWFTSYYFNEMLTIFKTGGNVTLMYMTRLHVDVVQICWCDPLSSPTGSRPFCKKLYATPRKITYNDVIYNVFKMEKKSSTTTIVETARCSALKPGRITYKAKPYKTYPEAIRAVIWEDSYKLRLICSKNAYKNINGTESPSL